MPKSWKQTAIIVEINFGGEDATQSDEADESGLVEDNSLEAQFNAWLEEESIGTYIEEGYTFLASDWPKVQVWLAKHRIYKAD